MAFNPEVILAEWQALTTAKDGPQVLEQHSLGVSIYDVNEHLKQAVALDPSGLLMSWLLHLYLKRFLERRYFTAYELLQPEGKQRLEKYLAQARRLFEYLEDPAIKEAQAAFSQMLGKALEHYGVADRQDIRKLLADEAEMTYLWRDALAATTTTPHRTPFNSKTEMRLEELLVDYDLDIRLNLMQFFRGPADTQPPVFMRWIYQFRNLHDVVSATAQMPRSGIMLFLVKEVLTDTDQWEKQHKINRSFFGFAVRNGGRVFVLTDRKWDAHHRYDGWNAPRHPDGWLERQDREGIVRKPRHHFPYPLLTDDGDLKLPNCTEIAVYDGEDMAAKRVMPVSALPAKNLVWTVMVFGLLQKLLFNEGYEADELTYTGRMIQNPTEVTEKALVVADNYIPLRLEPITSSMLKTLAPEEYKSDAHHNDWMEERYGDVDPTLLNLVGDVEKYAEIPEPVSTFSRRYGAKVEVRRVRLASMQVERWGTAAALRSHQIRVARENQAIIIQARINEEYNRMCEEVLAWFTNAVIANRENLIRYIREGKLMVRDQDTLLDPNDYPVRNILTIATRQEMENSGLFGWGRIRIHLHKGTNHANVSTRRCWIYGVRDVTYQARFLPSTPEGLAALAGCTVEELPWPLQHWTAHEIIPRSDDPVQHIKNPWCKEEYGVMIHLSKRAYKDILSGKITK